MYLESSFLSPDSNNDIAVKELQKATIIWGDKIKTSHLYKNAMQIATGFNYYNIPLSALTFTHTKCTRVL